MSEARGPATQDGGRDAFKSRRLLREQAVLEIFEYIECSCNRIGIRSAIGWMSPADYEAKMSEEAAKAA